MRRGSVVAVLLGGLLAVGTSCTDAGRLPTGASTEPSAVQLLGPQLQLVDPVERATPLAEDLSWTFEAGPGGATSSNPAVGLTIVVPAGALSGTTTITVTALAGTHVAYRFTPHVVFAANVRLVQALSQTNPIVLTGLVGAHIDGDLSLVNGLAAVSETVPAFVSLLTGTISFDVRHFSGWVVASGNGGQSADSSGSSSQ